MIREIGATTTNNYAYGPDLSGTLQGAGTIGGLLLRESGGSVAFYCYDANGNVTGLVDANGTIVASYTYDPFGNTIAKQGGLSDANPFRFSSKYVDAETGLYYYGSRYYNPPLGRCLSRDPIAEKGSPNLFAHGRNSPVSRSCTT